MICSLTHVTRGDVFLEEELAVFPGSASLETTLPCICRGETNDLANLEIKLLIIIWYWWHKYTILDNFKKNWF